MKPVVAKEIVPSTQLTDSYTSEGLDRHVFDHGTRNRATGFHETGTVLNCNGTSYRAIGFHEGRRDFGTRNQATGFHETGTRTQAIGFNRKVGEREPSVFTEKISARPLM